MFSRVVSIPIIIVLILASSENGIAQDEGAELFSIYVDIEQKLQAIRAGAAQLKDDLQFYTFEVDKINQNDGNTEITDVTLATELADSQMKRDVDLAKLLKSSNLWIRNFRIVNKTLTNIRKKVSIGQPVMKFS